jgi:3-phenylpropionate/trans-cinnamate dioxygenase ferredoxin reductase component
VTSGDILIVGAGQAGGRAAEALRKSGWTGRIILVGDEVEPPYERPPLSKAVLTGEKMASVCRLLPENFYAEHGIEHIGATRVVSIDAAAHRAMLDDGRVFDYAKLILATGGRVRTLPFAPIGRPGVFYLRTIADSLALGAAFKRARRLVVIGGGFLGLEAAASARKLGLEVALIELAPHLLDRAMHHEIAHLVAAIHRRKGVEFHLGMTAAGLVGSHGIEAVELANRKRIAADLVLVAVGILPNVELAASAGCAVENGIMVDEFGRTSVADIYAVGDAANHPNPILGRRLRLESWQNAQNHAIAIAQGIAGTPTPYAEVPWFWSDQYEFNIQMVGAPLKTDRIVVRGDPAGGRFICFNLAGAALVGATSFNMGGETRFLRRLIERRAEIDPAQLADPTRKLRDLAAALPAA